jgi:hypothetical protein
VRVAIEPAGHVHQSNLLSSTVALLAAFVPGVIDQQRRMASAAAAKKCPRLSQRWSSVDPTSRIDNSCARRPPDRRVEPAIESAAVNSM